MFKLDFSDPKIQKGGFLILLVIFLIAVLIYVLIAPDSSLNIPNPITPTSTPAIPFSENLIETGRQTVAESEDGRVKVLEYSDGTLVAEVLDSNLTEAEIKEMLNLNPSDKIIISVLGAAAERDYENL